MDIIGAVKQVADLAKKAGQMELYRQLVDLQGEIVKNEGEIVRLSRENNELKLKREELEKQLRFSRSLTFRAPFYYAEGDDVPYCPKCWEAEHAGLHLVGMSWGGGTRYDCPKCNWTHLPPGRGPQVVRLTR